jgi:hypothetical protein
MIKKYKEIRKFYNAGKRFLNDSFHINVHKKSIEEMNKRPLRTDIINYLLKSLCKSETKYLEIGVRNPNDNFALINSDTKFGVDPGIEFKENPVDFKLTSDTFFEQIKSGNILTKNIKFDVIFIDGLHLAEQVERDIQNALDYITDDGFVVLHDCNPPSEFHASETHAYKLSPAYGYWNGTTWKAFFKYRKKIEYYSCCIDADWGIGIISKKVNFGKPSTVQNPYYEFNVLEKYRLESLNLLSFEDLKKIIDK